jgi:hypothetical protein
MATQSPRHFQLDPLGVGIDQRDGRAGGRQHAHDLVEHQLQCLVRVLGVADQPRDVVQRVQHVLFIVGHGWEWFAT